MCTDERLFLQWWLTGGKYVKNSRIYCRRLKKGHQNFWRWGESGSKNYEGNILVETCSHEFFLKHALPVCLVVWPWHCLCFQGHHPSKSMKHIPLYFQKIHKFLPYFIKFSKFLLFSFNLRFLLNLRVFVSPYFSHDAFLHHALHMLDATSASTTCYECGTLTVDEGRLAILTFRLYLRPDSRPPVWQPVSLLPPPPSVSDRVGPISTPSSLKREK